MRILAVEDDERLVVLLQRGLREEGHMVDACGTCADALGQAQTIAYDVILLDWMLPDGDGLSLLRTWRDRGVETPVLMLTARGAVGEVLTRSELLASVWGPSFDGEPNVLDVYVGYVRGKLAQLGDEAPTIRAQRGVGFRLLAAEARK